MSAAAALASSTTSASQLGWGHVFDDHVAQRDLALHAAGDSVGNETTQAEGQGGFACAGGAGDADEFAALDTKGQALQRFRLASGIFEV